MRGLTRWIVGAKVHRVIDGDTFVADLHIFPGMRIRKKIRVLGVDTPELRGESREAGKAAKVFAQEWLKGKSITVCFAKLDSFGRILADVYGTDATTADASLADALIDAGHYTGRYAERE